MRKPILITGSHLSGSTWVGKMICLSPEVAYIHEPFNLRSRKGRCNIKIDKWFTYIDEFNEDLYEKCFIDTLNFRYNLPAEIKSIRSVKDIARMFRDFSKFTYYRFVSHPRPLLKDPIAVMSAEWLARRFEMNIVILIRHPAGFINSLKSRGWRHQFIHFLSQDEMMKKKLSKYKIEINYFLKNEHDIIDEGILLWKIIYSEVIKYQKKHPDWSFVRYEDIAINPLKEFKKLYMKLNVNYTPEIRNKINEYTNPQNTKEIKFGNIKRDSKSMAYKWKEKLTTSEIKYIKKNVTEVSRHFYNNNEW